MQPRSARLPSNNELKVMHVDEAFRVRLVNISTTGARLDHLGDLPQDAFVTLRHLQMRAPAYVAWSNDKETGVRFATPLSTADMDTFRKADGEVGVWASLGHQEAQTPN